MQVSQAFFNDSNSEPPYSLRACMDTVKIHFPAFPHILYNLESARTFLHENMEPEIVAAFDKIKPYAYKADLFRYCVLYLIGGWYFDCSVRINTSVNVPDDIQSVAFRDFPLVTNSAWSVWNGAMYSKPQNPVYEIAIKLVLENCRSSHYGTCNLCPTGPVLFGRAFAMIGDQPGNLFFNHIYLTPGYHIKNPALVLSDGVVFAFLKNSGPGDLSSFGAVGTNSYPELYASRNVYN